MTAQRDLFHFSKFEAKDALKASKLIKSIPGLKLLASALPDRPECAPEGVYRRVLHGKLLLVIPRAFGKAHERNLLRRRLRSIYYEEKLYLRPIISMIICYKQAQTLSFEQLRTFLIENLADAS